MAHHITPANLGPGAGGVDTLTGVTRSLSWAGTRPAGSRPVGSRPTGARPVSSRPPRR